jgi:hypothetical protein
MPWNSLTSTTAIAVIQDLLIEQLDQATPEAEDMPEEVMYQIMEVGALCWGTPSSHAME